MAHRTDDNEGPFPDKAGEFYGNHHPDWPLYLSINDTTEEMRAASLKHHKEWLAGMRFGKPSNCAAGTSKEMEAQGYVGLYLKEDRKLYSFETPLETDALTEAVVSK